MKIEQIKKILSYDPISGNFQWLGDTAGHRKNEKVGYLEKSGYLSVSIFGSKIRLHRLAMIFAGFDLKEKMVDHVNLNKSDNRLSNLRIADNSKNKQNCGIRKDNSSGIKGVFRSRNGWQGQIQIDGKRISVGHFKNLKDAVIPMSEARKKYHKEFARIK